MELKFLEETKNKVVFEIKGESHLFCNALKEAVSNDSRTKLVSYRIGHPLVGIPTFIIETDGTEPRKVLADAAGKLAKEFDKFLKAFKEAK